MPRFIYIFAILTTCTLESGCSHLINEETSFSSSIDGVKLTGTISNLKDGHRCPVLMIGGSGKTDRDETVPPMLTFSGKTEKLFEQISNKLTQSGFITFRYEKRGVIDSDGNVDLEVWKTADREHLISDAFDAAKLLLDLTKTESDKLIILGHSEGTVIATEVAIRLGGKVKGLMLLGAQARSMEDMLYYQIVESRAAEGSKHDREVEFSNALRSIAETKETFAPDGKPINWYRQFLAAPSNENRIKAVSGNIAVFQGTVDPQTPLEEVERFKIARPDLLTFTYIGLGHGFSPDKDGRPTLGPVDMKVLDDINTVAISFCR
jgi:pimeloyl-ACP methyl ester carboxylesterase